jgi:hypothetical protein
MSMEVVEEEDLVLCRADGRRNFAVRIREILWWALATLTTLR